MLFNWCQGLEGAEKTPGLDLEGSRHSSLSLISLDMNVNLMRGKLELYLEASLGLSLSH